MRMFLVNVVVQQLRYCGVHAPKAAFVGCLDPPVCSWSYYVLLNVDSIPLTYV